MASAALQKHICMAAWRRRFASHTPPYARLMRAVLLWGSLFLIAALMRPAQAAGPTPQPPDWRGYTVEFKPLPPGIGKLRPPENGFDAVESTPQRAGSIIQHFSCGLENTFLSLAARQDPAAK